VPSLAHLQTFAQNGFYNTSFQHASKNICTPAKIIVDIVLQVCNNYHIEKQAHKAEKEAQRAERQKARAERQAAKAEKDAARAERHAARAERQAAKAEKGK
jgi:uncharacterized protein (DUF3084 family)